MYFAIITAGGTGQRMASASPKQFIRIGGKPVIVHTIEKFLEFNNAISLFLTLPKDYFAEWKNIKNEFLSEQKINLIIGGKTRFHSIQNALNQIPEQNGLLAIHDAVRPFVTVDIINNCFQKASEYGSGITAIQLKDSIREINNERSFARDRNKYKLMQTPQTFDLKKIKDAYKKVNNSTFTDDAGVWEEAGNQVYLVEGHSLNIKITFPEDLILAEAILNQ